MMIPTRAEAETLLFTEALLLDTGRWDEWLALYTDTAEFHMPAWIDETTPTGDPAREVSLIWYRGKRNLADRVWRARSGLSLASSPPQRVVHMISNVLPDPAAPGVVTSAFACHCHDPRSERAHVFFGRYRHELVYQDQAWRIAKKHILLLNDRIPTLVDFYMV